MSIHPEKVVVTSGVVTSIELQVSLIQLATWNCERQIVNHERNGSTKNFTANSLAHKIGTCSSTGTYNVLSTIDTNLLNVIFSKTVESIDFY